MSTLLDQEKCRQRNRLAAKRDEIEAVPMQVFKAPPQLASAPGIRPLPSDLETALSLINAKLPAGSQPLSAHDVYVRYGEAANSNFIPDRFMFLGDSTLLNIARNAESGFAFMNSHRTGGLSSPAELPYGRTFAGQYESLNGSGRSVIGFYMLKGVHPAGEQGPSTDELVRMIDGGTVFDLSVGLSGGSKVCDVCAQDFRARDPEGNYLCNHVPGTHRKMTPEQITAQLGRGVTRGVASYTLHDAYCGETSAVYDGAVPGAGFRKALDLARQHALSAEELEEARFSYATLLSKGDLDMEQGIVESIQQGFDKLAQRLGLRDTEQASPPPAPAPTPNTVTFTQQEADRLKALAADGERFRTSLLKRCQEEYTRATGEEASAEQLSAFEQLPTDILSTTVNSYAKLADDKFNITQQQGALRQTAPKQLANVSTDVELHSPDQTGERMAQRARRYVGVKSNGKEEN